MTDALSPREAIRLARVSGVRLALHAVAHLRPSDDPVRVLARLITELQSQTDPLALPASLVPTTIPERNMTP